VVTGIAIMAMYVVIASRKTRGGWHWRWGGEA
jgi:hypothetical protein